jgi:DNA gyrase subunit A
VIIRTGVGSISVQGRSATGVRVMNLDGESKVAAVARVLSSEDGSDEDGPGPVDPDGADDAAPEQADPGDEPT